MIKYVSFAKVLDWLGAGFHGPSLQHWVEGLLGEVDAEPEYTVYWPKDSIRAIPGSSYAVAVTVLAILADSQTTNYGDPTGTIPGVLARPRRQLNRPEYASHDQAHSLRTFAKDRLLPGDTSNISDRSFHVEQAEAGVTYRLDMTTVPRF